MVNYQVPLPKFSSAYLDLIDENNKLVNYFRSINLYNIHPVVKKCYSGSGPQGIWHGSLPFPHVENKTNICF